MSRHQDVSGGENSAHPHPNSCQNVDERWETLNKISAFVKKQSKVDHSDI